MNLSNILVLLYVGALAIMSFIDYFDFEHIVDLCNIILFSLSGGFSLLWLIWRPFSCFGVKCCKPDKITKRGKKGACRLYAVLLIISIGFVMESLIVVYYNTDDYLSFLSPFMELITFESMSDEIKDFWRFIIYCIDLIILTTVLIFYIPITWHSIHYVPSRPSQISANFHPNFDHKRVASAEESNSSKVAMAAPAAEAAPGPMEPPMQPRGSLQIPARMPSNDRDRAISHPPISRAPQGSYHAPFAQHGGGPPPAFAADHRASYYGQPPPPDNPPPSDAGSRRKWF